MARVASPARLKERRACSAEATSVDAVIAEAEVTKGAFFHHFPSKNDLGRALLQRYAAADSETLQALIAAAEDETDDPAGQVVAFVRLFAHAAEEFARTQSGCLFASFIYERELDDGRNQIIADGIREWRERLLAKLEAAAAAHALPDPCTTPHLNRGTDRGLTGATRRSTRDAAANTTRPRRSL
jgi:AcrR family transcriptional regulator